MVITSTVYWKFRQSLVSQATLQPLIMCADSLLICFIAVEIVKTNLNTPIWKAWGSASRAQRPLPTGIVRRQFPSLRGTTWRNKGRSAWNGSRFEHICAFYVEITNIQGVKLKMSCYNRRVPTGPYFREKSLFSIVALPALEKSLLLNIFDRSPGKVLIFNRCVKTWMINIVLRKLRFSKCCGNDVELFGNPSDPLTNHRWRVV